MGTIQSSIADMKATAGADLGFKVYAPEKYGDLQKPYYRDESRIFTEEYAKYSNDFVSAEIQGLDPDKPFEYTNVHIRFSDIVRSSSVISYEFDNYKVILVAERQYSYLRRGAKIKCMGNTWLVINPDNMSNTYCKAVIQRCDAVWHYFDYYGNVCTEPMCFDEELLKANESDSQRATMITKGYMNCKVQYNNATKQLFNNARMVLGRSVYRLSGFSDFIQEFTEDESSIDILSFTARYEEPNDAIDDMINKVAGGLTFSWDIQLAADKQTIAIGDSAQLVATSIRTSGETTEVVESTTDNPISYTWESSDAERATVDATGTVTALSEGDVTISCTLDQNTAKRAEFELKIENTFSAAHMEFDGTIPRMLRLYESASITAHLYGGSQDEDVITWTFSGADKNAYSCVISEDRNTATIKCWGGSVEPLTITAACGEYSTSAEIILEGI